MARLFPDTNRTKSITRWGSLSLLIFCLLIFYLFNSGDGRNLSAAELDPGSDYSITWQTTQVGGGFSTGGEFSVAGTVGQPDTTQVQGGDFEINGGYWNEESEPIVSHTSSIFLPVIGQR